jgi:hypothetical protein
LKPPDGLFRNPQNIHILRISTNEFPNTLLQGFFNLLFATQGGARFTSLALGYYLSGFQPFQFELSHVCCYALKSFSALAFTAASILMRGGQGRLKPSPGIFFVASMRSLLPPAISLVA